MLALILVLEVFAVVVFMIRKRVPLGVSLVTGAVLVPLVFDKGPLWIGAAIVKICSDDDSRLIVLLIAEVLALSMVLERSGQIGRLTESLRGFVTNRKLASAVLPSIVGLLPMPGGALFSAPMVKTATGDMILDNHKKVEINHWFRHVWEYSWPLYPGIIYTAKDVLGLEIKQLLLLQFPLTLAAIAIGFLIVMRGVRVRPAAGGPSTSTRRRAALRFLFELSPFLLIIVLYLVLNVPLLLSLIIAIAFAVAVNTLRGNVKPLPLARGIFTSTHYLNFIVMGYGVVLFGGMLRESGAITELTAFFSSSSLPVLVIITVLPFIVGFVAGITIVYCTTTFPLIMALPAVAANPVPYIVLAFTAGFMGTMLSPLHACLALSSQYFKGSLMRVILRLAPAALGVLAMGFALWALYSHWQPF